MTAVLALRDGPWTLERLKDELFCQLAVYDKYYDQVRAIIYRIPVKSPTPAFRITLSDLSSRIVSELKACSRKARSEVITQAVGRLFENVNYQYYHQSVMRFLSVELT